MPRNARYHTSANMKVYSLNCQALRDAVEFLIRRAEQQAHVAEMIRATMLGHYRQANSTAAAQSPTREATDNDHPHGEANDFVSPMPAETPQCDLWSRRLPLRAMLQVSYPL